MSSLHDQAIGLFVFFPVLTTITVGLRLFVRTRLCKGAFGWDDVALVVTYVGLLLWVGLAWQSVSAGFGSEEWSMYTAAKNDVCYVISGVVKISVALVLYRLDERPPMRAVLVADMAVCAVWTVAAAVVLGLGCQAGGPLDFGAAVCRATNYAQEASYVVFNVLHVVIPVVILWGVQIRDNLKWAVVSLFSVGILAAIAAVLKLQVYVELYNPTPSTDYAALWHRSMIWAVCEHGLSLFAASVLAVRPFFTYLSSSLSTLSGSWSAGGGSAGVPGGKGSAASAASAASSASSSAGRSRRTSSRASAASGWPLSGRGPGTSSPAPRRSDVELEPRAAGPTTRGACAAQEFGESPQTLVYESKETREPGDIV